MQPPDRRVSELKLTHLHVPKSVCNNFCPNSSWGGKFWMEYDQSVLFLSVVELVVYVTFAWRTKHSLSK